MDLNNILSQLGAGGSKDVVYLSVTPGVGLELSQVDGQNHVVKEYSYRPLEYNESLREIADIEAFKMAAEELFAEMKVKPKTNIVLNIPMVLFGIKELPLLLGDDAVTEALTSEVEQSYIFKRCEPAISWSDASQVNGDMRKLFYSAIQKNSLEQISAALNELGMNLAGVELSMVSMLKALCFTGLADEQIKDNSSWNLMVINPNGYSICSMYGKNIVDYYEEPLAIKSFEGEEIYNAISASAQITLMSYPANSLFIVSETDMVSAELLSKRIPLECPIRFWDNNAYKKQDALPVSLEILEESAHKVSLEAIGVAVSQLVPLPVKFDFLRAPGSEAVANDPNEVVHVVLGSLEFDISPNAARNISMLVSVLMIVPVLVLFLVVPAVLKQKQEKLEELNSKLQTVQNSIKEIEASQNKTNDFDINLEIKKVMSNNRSKLMAYTALGESVPKKLWITYFMAKEDGKIDIKGESKNVEDIYVFFKNMKDSMVNTKLRLHNMNMKSVSVDEAVSIDPNAPTDYDFEVTNMTSIELNPPPKEENTEEVASEGKTKPDKKVNKKKEVKNESKKIDNQVNKLGSFDISKYEKNK